jgi:hypothetical protein
MRKQRKRYSAQFVTDHKVLFLETICVSPVVFLAFAAGETPAPERSRGERGGAGLSLYTLPPSTKSTDLGKILSEAIIPLRVRFFREAIREL